MNLLKKRKTIAVVLTVMVMLIVFSIAAAFLYMISVKIKIANYNVESAKAFWLAEAGLEQVMYKLKSDNAFRAGVGGVDNPGIESSNLNGGSYSVTVTKDSKIYSLVSIGEAGMMKRKITQSVVLDDLGIVVTPRKDWNEIIIEEMVHDGNIPFQQFQQAK